MKNIHYLLITVMCVIAFLLTTTVNATCTSGTVYVYASYSVTDAYSSPGDSYRIYLIVTDDCPSSSGQIYLQTITQSGLGSTYSLSGNTATLNLPIQYESALYYKIHIYVEKWNNGSLVSTSTRYSYADRDYSTNYLTARTQPITVPF